MNKPSTLIDPDAVAREVIKDAHMLADEKRWPVSINRDGIEVIVDYDEGSKSLVRVRTPERM